MFHVKHRQSLQVLFSQQGIQAPDRFLEGAARHLEQVYKWNQRMDLTAIPETEAAEKHTLDSILPFVGQPPPPTLLDIGSGAGFPGVPLALWWPATSVTLLEPLRKRRSFLESCSALLELSTHVRGEQAEQLTGSWSLITSRATLPWQILLSVSLPLLTPGGTLIALLGPEQSPSSDQIAEICARDAGWAELQTTRYTLPSGAPRVRLVGRSNR